MVPASPISGIMCDHYPVPLITARQYVSVSEKESEKDRGCFVRKEWVPTVWPACVRLWHRKAGERALGMKNAYLCVHTADPLCCRIHPVISNYREPQVFAAASARLLDLICSNTKRQSAINTLIRGKTWPTVLCVVLRSCWEALKRIITCIWVMYFN